MAEPERNEPEQALEQATEQEPSKPEGAAPEQPKPARKRFKANPPPVDVEVSVPDLWIKIGGIEYLMVEDKTDRFYFMYADDIHEHPILAFVYSIPWGTLMTRAYIEDFNATYLARDDVFQPAFYHNVIFYRVDPQLLDKETSDYVSSFCTNDRCSMSRPTEDSYKDVKNGPLVLHEGTHYHLWRLYRDTRGCFAAAFRTRLSDPGTLLAVDGGGRVVVPSRAYHEQTDKHPLGGVRVVVRDNMDIAGHVTGLDGTDTGRLGLQTARTETAACIQALVDQGAVLVGKTKCSPLNMLSDNAAHDATAASIASYAWLDFAVGSETAFGNSQAAAPLGCFSVRPTVGAVDAAGIHSFSREFEAPVLYGRDLAAFAAFLRAWYGGSALLLQPRARVRVLHALDFDADRDGRQAQRIESFAAGLASACNTEHRAISLAGQWTTDLPAGKDHADLAAYLAGTDALVHYDQHHNAAESKFSTSKAAETVTVTREQRDALAHRVDVYQQWIRDAVLAAQSADVLTVMVLPARVSGGPPSGFSAASLAPLARVPEIVAPVADVQDGPCPVAAASVVGPPGSDLLLLDVVEEGMKAAGLATTVAAGAQHTA